MPDDRDRVERQKRALRAQLRERRRAREHHALAAADEALTTHLVELVRRTSATSCSAYLSTPDEPSTRGFLAWSRDAGIRVLLPVSREDGLLDWAPYDGGIEEEDVLGMPAPTSELQSPLAINEVDLILVPAACVDRTGMRMGWGGGYFDKTLGSMEACPPVYAVVFDEELVDAVPHERHDVPVHGAVTPSGIVTF